MMRPLYLLFLLFSLALNAQVPINLHIYNAYDNESLLPYSLMQPDYYYTTPYPLSYLSKNTRIFAVKSIEQLSDTFVFKQIGFKERRGLITSYDYSVYKDGIRLLVALEPYTTQFLLNLPVAQSPKTSNDSVLLKAYFPFPPDKARVSLHRKNGAKICDLSDKATVLSHDFEYLYLKKIDLDDLADGYFKTATQDSPGSVVYDSFAFAKADWAQTHFLKKNKPKPYVPEELVLLIRYFEAQEDYKKRNQAQIEKYDDLYWRLNRKLEKLEFQADSLEWVLKTLKYGLQPSLIQMPEPVPPPYDPEEEWLKEVSFCSDAKPKNGDMPSFLSHLKKIISNDYECPYSGEISLEIMVLQDGYVLCNSLHCPPDAEQIKLEIIRQIESIEWQPAIQGERVVKQSFILTFKLLHN